MELPDGGERNRTLAEDGMKRFSWAIMGVVLGAGLSLAVPATPQGTTFAGSIGDSMCGAKHMPGESAKDCTLGCVKDGSKYILIDPSGKIYQLSDQKTPEKFAGASVKVTGTLKGDTITVTSIVAAP
jgi:hypothetical protein